MSYRILILRIWKSDFIGYTLLSKQWLIKVNRNLKYPGTINQASPNIGSALYD